MKNIRVFAIAALAAVGLSSCIKEKVEAPIVSEGNYELTIRLAGAKSSRAITAPGTATEATFNEGHIYVFAENALVTDQAFAAADIASGLTLTDKVPAGSQVFIVGNTNASKITLPAATAITSASDIMDAVHSVSGLVTSLNVPLATINPVADATTAKTFAAQTIIEDVAPTATAYGEAHVDVMLAPVVSRLELASVQDHADSDSDLTNGYTPDGGINTAGEGFNVIGIYLTGYAPRFTLKGTADGALVSYVSGGASNFGDVGTWAGVSGTATPESVGTAYVDTWTYNIAAGAPARLVAVVQSTTALDESGTDLNGDGDSTDENVFPIRNLEVKSYSINTFSPGMIYRVAYIPFDSSIFEVEPELLEDYELTVTIDVIEWGVQDITVNM